MEVVARVPVRLRRGPFPPCTYRGGDARLSQIGRDAGASDASGTRVHWYVTRGGATRRTRIVGQRPTRSPVEREYRGSTPRDPTRGHSSPRLSPLCVRVAAGVAGTSATHTPFSAGPVPWRMKELTMRNGEVVDADDLPDGILHVTTEGLSDEQMAAIREELTDVDTSLVEWDTPEDTGA